MVLSFSSSISIKLVMSSLYLGNIALLSSYLNFILLTVDSAFFICDSKSFIFSFKVVKSLLRLLISKSFLEIQVIECEPSTIIIIIFSAFSDKNLCKLIFNSQFIKSKPVNFDNF